MPAPATEREILDVNRRYHDVAAREYDAKWGISFGEVGRDQVLGKLSKLLGPRPGPFARSLEIGAGTGYFSLNLLKAGVGGDWGITMTYDLASDGYDDAIVEWKPSPELSFNFGLRKRWLF